VEDAQTFALLRGRNCDVVQGHLFAKAMPLDAFVQWLRQPVEDPTAIAIQSTS
jgi:EAL domain-containing protein (putative c-di-GMP-specific phosphodiesterase class I)